MDTAPGNSIAISLRVAKAMALARQGKMKDAQALISVDRAIPEDALSLETLAALTTSEGDYLRALRLWEQLLQRRPEHAEARRMIDAIELWLSRPTWAKFVPLGLATAVALIVAGIFWAVASGPTPAAPARPAAGTGPSPVATSPTARPTPSPVYTAPARPVSVEPPPVVSFPVSRPAAKPTTKR